MSNARTHGGYRTGGLWAAAGISFGAVVVGSAIAVFGMMEFDERCQHGLTQGPGRLLRVRDQAFPPATICEFQYGEVSSIGGGECSTCCSGAAFWSWSSVCSWP